MTNEHESIFRHDASSSTGTVTREAADAQANYRASPGVGSAPDVAEAGSAQRSSNGKIRRIAISTGGGDAPGLNAVIRAATLAASQHGWEVVGIRRGYAGLLDPSIDEGRGIIPLNRRTVSGITHLGGTILGTTSRGKRFGIDLPEQAEAGKGRDLADEIVARFRDLELDALIAIGGDGSLSMANALHQKGLPVVGVPKTIDNDLRATDITFGFRTAVEVATDAIGRLHSTAEAHQRVMVVEVMGRHTGWIALEAGLAGGADVILIPEVPYSVDRIAEKIQERERAGRRFSIVVVAEGARPKDGEPSYAQGTRRYGGLGERLAEELANATGKETRSLVLGHTQRGGSPIAYDRLLALQFGAAAVRCVEQRHFGSMVALRGQSIHSVPLAEAVQDIKRVPQDSSVLETARELGISVGE